MSLKRKLQLIIVLWVFSLAGCGLPAARETQSPAPAGAGSPSSAAPSPAAASPAVPPTLAATATKAPSPVPPTPTPVRVDLNLATLRLEDMPKGFQTLDEKSQAQAGLSPESIRQSFSGIFRQAQLLHSFAFVTSDPKNFEIVVGLVFAPILPAEQASFDSMLVDPNGAIKNFAKSFGGEAKALANLPNLGDSRTGWSFTTASGQPPLKGEMVISRRDTLVALLLAMFPSDQKPAAAVANLAQALDTAMKKALGQ